MGHWERWGEESRGLKEKEEKNGGEQKEDGLRGRVLLLPMTPGLQGSTPLGQTVFCFGNVTRHKRHLKKQTNLEITFQKSREIYKPTLPPPQKKTEPVTK